MDTRFVVFCMVLAILSVAGFMVIDSIFSDAEHRKTRGFDGPPFTYVLDSVTGNCFALTASIKTRAMATIDCATVPTELLKVPVTRGDLY